MYNAEVFTSHVDSLRRKKSAAENRDISIRFLATDSGVSQDTLRRLRRQPESVTIATLGTLLRYFKCKSIAELIEWKPDAPTEQPTRVNETKAGYNAEG